MKSQRFDRAIQAVIDAWNIEGRAPAFHEAAKRKLAKEWPTLFKAVKNLAENT